MKERTSEETSIAVIGIGTLFPGAIGNHGLWHSIVDREDLFTDVPVTHWLTDDYYDPDKTKPGKTYVRRGAFVSDTPFDPLEFGIPPSQLSAIDTAQLLALVVARRVLDEACHMEFTSIDRDRTSVIMGVCAGSELMVSMSQSLGYPHWAKALREAGIPDEQAKAIVDRIGANYPKWTEAVFPGLLGNVIAGRIASRFDLGGTNCAVDAACASSLGALKMAIQELIVGDSDMAIAGGVDALNDVFMYMCFSKTPALSLSEDCRPFSRASDGTMLGEGLAMFALRRLADAERDGNRIYGVIRGMGSSSDGFAKSIYAPRPEGQAKALRRAYSTAGYAPRTVTLLEGHGTGTPAGDAAELQALHMVFGEDAGTERRWCALGSVKSQIGHTKSAAGAASLYKVLMALHHKVLPPMIKVDEPAAAIASDGPFYVNTALRPWIARADHPRRAGVSSFGFGGSNFHMTIEEYEGPGAKPALVRMRHEELFLFSAETHAALALACKDGVAACKIDIALAARDAQRRFSASAPLRLAIVARDAAELETRTAHALSRIAGVPAKPFHLFDGTAFAAGPAPDDIVFLFPGQGSQYVEMGIGPALHIQAARRVWDEANKQFDAAGLPLSDYVFPPPAFSVEERLAQAVALTATDIAQPALGVTSLMYLELLHRAGISPSRVAGHSFGEVIALHAAGVLDRAETIAVCRARGQFMAEAARTTQGAMAAVKGAAEKVQAKLDEIAGAAVIANFNAPDQVVIAGPVTAIDAAETALAASGLRPHRLSVGTAFHTAIVAPACAPFAAMLDAVAFRPGSVPAYANSTAAPYPRDAAAARTTLATQIVKPVRFAEMLNAIQADGNRTAHGQCFIEVRAPC